MSARHIAPETIRGEPGDDLRSWAGPVKRQPRQQLMADLHGALLRPEHWPVALRALTEYAGGVDATYVLKNNVTHEVDWACFSGAAAAPSLDKLLAALDPDLPVRTAARRGRRPEFRRVDETAGLVGARVCDTGTHSAFFGIDQGDGSHALSPSRLRELVEPLGQVAQLHCELRARHRKAAIAQRGLDQFGVGIIVIEADGRVREMNAVAAHFLKLGEGLVLRDGRLEARRVFEMSRLAALIADATALGADASLVGNMLIGRSHGRLACCLTATPLPRVVAGAERPAALLLLVDPERRLPSTRTLADLFGLSRAECRLALDLAVGRTLQEVAGGRGRRITTLRTQVSSILRKVGVDRQSDLMRVMANLPPGFATDD